MDIITINDLKLPTLIGVHPHERLVPQTLIATLSFGTDTKNAAQQDKLEHAIDYEAISTMAINFAKEAQFKLLETFAERLVALCFEKWPLEWVRCSIEKKGCLKEARSVTLSIERKKG